MFYVLFAGLLTILTIILAAHDQYHVHPDDTPCLQPPCHTLEYFTNNSDEYFVSDTTLLFDQGDYYHVKGNFIIQNVTNVSLIGTPNTSDHTSPVSVIRCSPNHHIYFYSVTTLLIKQLKFEECGSLVPEICEYKFNCWATLFFHFCTDLAIINSYIYNPVGYGILAFNVMGNNSLDNVTVIMGRQEKYNNSICSNGICWNYANIDSDTVKDDKEVITKFNNIILRDYCITKCCDCISDKRMLELSIDYFSVFIIIVNSDFSNWNDGIVMITVTSLSHTNINFHKCRFLSNHVTYGLIDLQYNLFSILDLRELHPILNICFSETVFSNTHLDASINIPLLKINEVSQCSHLLNIQFNNVAFYDNSLTLLEVLPSFTTSDTNQSSIVINTNGYFIAKGNKNLYDDGKLISLKYVHMHFNGITRFIDNHFGYIVHLSTSTMHFSNSTLFNNNFCINVISIISGKGYLVLSNSSKVTLTISNNKVINQIIHVSIKPNHPYPYCLFQYYSPNNNTSESFQINISFNQPMTQYSEFTEFIHDTIHQLTSHCKWAPGAAFQNVTPLFINNGIIKLVNENSLFPSQVGIHTTVCYCPSSSHYNCSVDQLGPVYPGENLTVDLCLPQNNEEFGVMYVEMYNNNLPNSACKIYKHDNMRHIFHWEKSRAVHFSIVSELPVCELFLTAQPNLFTSYDAFNVHLLPCPLGFTLQHGICDCDNDLRKYIDECMISSQTVRRLSNTYIFGINSTKQYMVSTDCPTNYCLQSTTRINLHHPDDQCQPHRTGLLCSQCIEGYSVVFGSNKCRKCSNLHLFYIIYFWFTGFFLIMILFLLNLTVTSGAVNGVILYVNMVRIISPFFLSQMETFLHSYIITTNAGPSFEMCFYNGMSMYAKIWIQLTYPIYLIAIATLFIIGSRYSGKLYRLTHNRALPVLATLFMLTYNSILQTIANTPLYSTIITIPSHSSKNLWLLDPTIPLFEWKFLLLISVCFLLFLLLLMFNAILLFTKLLMRFKIIHYFKPLIDAIQGPYKYQYYYWLGIQLLIRNVLVALCVLGKIISLTIGCIVIVTVAIIQGYIQPYKNKLINIQELLLLYNFAIMCILLIFNGNETMIIITVNVMVGLSFLHFLIILVYHLYAFVITIYCAKLTKTVTAIWNYIFEKCHSRKQIHNERFTMEIPDIQYNYASFREPLIGED